MTGREGLGLICDPAALLAAMGMGFEPFFFDCRFDFHQPQHARLAYTWRHIPGAHFIDLHTDMVANEGPGDHPFRDTADLISFLESLGISQDSPIVCYDDGNWSSPSRFACQLLDAGLRHVMVLDGGLPAWVQAGGITDTFPPAKATTRGKLPPPPPSFRIGIEDVRRTLATPGSLLIDSRAKARYLGADQPDSPTAGHIPGAYHLYYRAVLGPDNRFKSIAQLEELFLPLASADQIILSCGSGISACVLSLGLRLLDLPHTLYEGSFSDWVCRYPHEVEKAGRSYPQGLPYFDQTKSMLFP